MREMLLLTIAALVLAAGTAAAKDLVNVDSKGIALEGYDPVAFFTQGEAVKGDPAITATFQDATYRFAGTAHKATFEADPEKYVPAYGGWCAYGLAVAGKRFSVAIDTWQIVDGRLILNKNADVREKFDADRADMIEKADANWHELVAREKM